MGAVLSMRQNELDILAYGVRLGNEDSSSKLYFTLKRYLNEIITSRSIPGMTAGDIYHEIYIDIVTKISQWREESSFGTWCYPLAQRKIIDLWRSTQTAKRCTLDCATSIDQPVNHGPRHGNCLRELIAKDSGDIGSNAAMVEDVSGLLAKVRSRGVLSEYEEEALYCSVRVGRFVRLLRK